ncbi:MAG TPA: DEAD/DEAH box helicase [Kiritimatiellia bacterium]|nr:DEAD/DEAH box helicase [Kiritimatiellia bacterium]
MSSFTTLGLSPDLQKGVAELGFETPTPVQEKVIPLLIQGQRDLVALAQTGTGKTAAFGLPLLQLTDPAQARIQALVLAPTRELCVQIAKDLADFGRFAPHLRVLAVYGGAPIQTQIRQLQRGVHILAATPGRLNDLMRRGCVKLDHVQRVVLDEADEMLNMGFQEELESILKDVPDQARTLLFSATMPKQVAAMAAKYMNDPEEIILGTRNAGAANVTHECYTVHARDRYEALKRIIDARPGLYGIVFCRTRQETQDVAARLTTDGYNADTLHGDLSQDQRDRVMRAFRQRTVQILVATDVAARGLDVDDLTHVINYDLPGDPDVYTHRSGRTGRAGKAGISIVLIHMREHYKIRAIERIMNKRFENKQVPGGREICEAQLLAQLERIKAMPPPSGELDAFMPRINEALDGLSREELIQRFALRDLARFLDYYKSAPDLNAAPPHEHRDRPERGPRLERTAPVGEPLSGNVVRLRVNIGGRNGLTPPLLISIINRATPGPKLRLGRIRIMEQDSVFEVSSEAADLILPGLNRAEFHGRPVRAVVETDPTHGMGRGHAAGKRPGGFHKRPHGAPPHHRPAKRPSGPRWE